MSRISPAFAITSFAELWIPLGFKKGDKGVPNTERRNRSRVKCRAKGKLEKEKILPDPKYGDKVVAKFVNTIMGQGKKSVAESIFYRSLDIVTAKTKEDSLGVFKKAIENTRPTVEVRSRRVGGATYQVPIEVRPQRRLSLSMRWLIQSARERGEKSMEEKLAAEFIDAANNRGTAIKKKEDTHRMAEANRAFAHYRW